jgi:quinol monooxygenase YgiN
MQPVSYARHRFPPAVIQHAVWLYLRFTLSFRDVEELLAERGLDISYETVRPWVTKVGLAYARRLRRSRTRPTSRRTRMTTPPTTQADPFVLIVHEVADYAKWKVIFDDAAAIRREAGEIEYQLLTLDADRNRVVHFSRWSSLEAARGFFESPELVEIRRVAGVRAPEFLYLRQVEAGRL